MAGIANVFHVEFGINETELTRALERDDWNRAERLIIENSQSSYLDEGCYQRIPLFIALCGYQEGWLKHSKIRNLHIARLLIEHGANVNYRIPETCFMSEYMGPGQNALELVCYFYNELTSAEESMDHETRWADDDGTVFGLNKELVTEFDDLIDQLSDLMFIMLGHGGDPSIQDENRMTMLHRLLLYSSDIRLVQVLYENGADLNALDSKRNTPLAAFCEGTGGEDSDVAEGTVEPRGIREDFLQYLLSLKDVQVDQQNKYGCTALFHCMSRGDYRSAGLLLSHGCDTALRGTVSATENIKPKPLSPLLAYLCSPHITDAFPDVDPCNLWNKPVDTQHIAHLVDSGYFTTCQILSELQTYLEGIPVISNLPEMYLLPGDLSHLASLGTALTNLMFGGATATLKQLCVRKLFERIFLWRNHRIEDVVKFTDSYEMTQAIETDDDVLARPDRLQEIVITKANKQMLYELLTMLNLPKDLLVNFQVEQFRHNVCSQLRYVGHVIANSIPGISGSDSDNSSYPSDENDSDLEYW